MDMSVGCRLRYTIAEPTYFIFQILPALADGQVVQSESLLLPPNPQGLGYETDIDPITETRKIRALLGAGPIEIVYEARVRTDTDRFDPTAVQEFAFQNLPMRYLDYIAPSRYCPSDTFTEFAHQTFGAMAPGHGRVTAVCDWIFANIRYQGGSTGPSTNAADVFKSRQGVCRDFAHLGISLCRALGIPARYASVYADNLNPQDFHAVFQAYLLGPQGGAWFTFDPTRMSSVDAVVRIAAGRDAADVAFAWPQGEVQSQPPEVWADAPNRTTSRRTPLAVGS
jgi:transglutaminase-like putative cysteine protease